MMSQREREIRRQLTRFLDRTHATTLDLERERTSLAVVGLEHSPTGEQLSLALHHLLAARMQAECFLGQPRKPLTPAD